MRVAVHYSIYTYYKHTFTYACAYLLVEFCTHAHLLSFSYSRERVLFYFRSNIKIMESDGSVFYTKMLKP